MVTMSLPTLPGTAARLSFFGMSEDAPAPNSARARVDAVCSSSSPADAGTVHGSITLGRGGQIRVMVYPKNDDYPARLSIRRWAIGSDGQWSPVHRQDGILIHYHHARAFADAVAEACAALTSLPR
jgi:hypothetical protein